MLTFLPLPRGSADGHDISITMANLLFQPSFLVLALFQTVGRW
jgi:hypothetical protein